MVTLPLAAQYLEQQWGAAELLQFTAVIVVGSNVIASALSVIQFVVLRQDKAMYVALADPALAPNSTAWKRSRPGSWSRLPS